MLLITKVPGKEIALQALETHTLYAGQTLTHMQTLVHSEMLVSLLNLQERPWQYLALLIQLAP